MELYKQILIQILEESEIRIEGVDKIIEKRCYEALAEIIQIIKTPEFEDEECFMRIEKIITELEKLGVDCGLRHDFG